MVFMKPAMVRFWLTIILVTATVAAMLYVMSLFSAAF